MIGRLRDCRFGALRNPTSHRSLQKSYWQAPSGGAPAMCNRRAAGADEGRRACLVGSYSIQLVVPGSPWQFVQSRAPSSQNTPRIYCQSQNIGPSKAEHGSQASQAPGAVRIEARTQIRLDHTGRDRQRLWREPTLRPVRSARWCARAGCVHPNGRQPADVRGLQRPKRRLGALNC